MFRTGSGLIDAEHAFTLARRQSRRAALARSLRRDRSGRRLEVLCSFASPAPRRPAVREIPLDAIGGTLEPSRAAQFDAAFRPVRGSRAAAGSASGSPRTAAPCSRRSRSCGSASGYAVLDGHHRVSVARARGALAIDATVTHAERVHGA